MENASSAQGRTAPGANAQAGMQVERVDISPDTDVYNPGEVINIAIYFQKPFVGQCQVGLVPCEQRATDAFTGKTFSKSSSFLYEGQLYVRDTDIGACKLVARLAPVKGEAQTITISDRIFEVRPLIPAKR